MCRTVTYPRTSVAPNYAAKYGREKVKAEADNWDEWASWNTSRFMYLLWMRVFPFSEHWVMNMGGGLVDGMGTIFSEFFLATLLGNIPYIMFITKFGELLKHYWLQNQTTKLILLFQHRQNLDA